MHTTQKTEYGHHTYLWLTLVSVNIHYTGYIYKVVENPMQYAQLIQHIIGTLECSTTNIHAHNHVNEIQNSQQE